MRESCLCYVSVCSIFECSCRTTCELVICVELFVVVGAFRNAAAGTIVCFVVIIVLKLFIVTAYKTVYEKLNF